MESTELHDIDFISNPFTSFSEPTFFTPTTSSLRPDFVSDEPDSPKAKNEDEEDEYITELTRQMTNYMLQDDEKHQKSCGSGSGSPQSTLWSPFASGLSSPIGPSREPSPPLTPATVPVEKIMTKIDTKPVTIPFQSKQALIDDQIRSIQANFQKIKKEKEKERQRNADVLGHKARNYHHLHQNQRPRSGVKAVFVDGSGSRTGSGGTGVFLPRGHGTVVESRKKSGCSTVIIPARVVEALKVHFDKLGVPSTFSSDIPPFHDALLVSMNNKKIKSNKNTSLSRVQSGSPYEMEMSAESHQEPPADLPQEWTY
ncbi:unnamed protein product [Arabidopsis thaliana]|jgi:hypothetical protein|uniref:G patch domain protein n=4 Tax=Arabidopsis thaliana TaxID=3702 RepID=A0A654GDF8_ARATH|nr:G patch domain protein [Arabidopsis thaliana]AED97134.1 G patch domain protein [Arabidopsis thaliana]VYS70825.1 unnamed protein product [Arabidopsis thaliana]|eukprot:NP_200713.2 G patch domain protein [Arabidopsis thaliana]